MEERFEKLIIDGKTALIPLNFFNASISPFTKGENPNQVEKEPVKISSRLYNDHEISKQLFYKNITYLYHNE